MSIGALYEVFFYFTTKYSFCIAWNVARLTRCGRFVPRSTLPPLSVGVGVGAGVGVSDRSVSFSQPLEDSAVAVFEHLEQLVTTTIARLTGRLQVGHFLVEIWQAASEVGLNSKGSWK